MSDFGDVLPPASLITCPLHLTIILLSSDRSPKSPGGLHIQLRSTPSGRDLAALVRTCRIFNGPAVDVLWRDLDYIRPVLKCLPYNLLQHCPVPRSKRLSLGLGDLERPLIYSKRVRSLRVVLLDRRCAASYAASLFTEMCALVPAHEIFPNLQHLRWSLDQYLSQDLYHLFVPTVTHLTLTPASCLEFTACAAVFRTSSMRDSKLRQFPPMSIVLAMYPHSCSF
ncbi:hypothetical protein B0H14DRAFT_3673810 [Mycena olivaceomarginata]|nr:hypothetical protein B0H14DRAFT_3673810 [Mycena olivaceomarginata]